MTDHPILFSAPMVRALLSGRKTQTRRVMTIDPGFFSDYPDGAAAKIQIETITFVGYRGKHRQVHAITKRRVLLDGTVWPCVSDFVAIKYAPGNRLWVREAWRTEARFDDLPPRDVPVGSLVSYEADYDREPNDGCRGRYRHGRFMPRWASRLTLTVTDVRVQRLHDIGEADAAAEGVYRIEGAMPIIGHSEFTGPVYGHPPTSSYRDAYAALWDRLHGPGAWAANPWGVAYTFTVEQRKIQAETAP